MKITLKNYEKLLAKIQQKIVTTKANIVANVNRQKVVMSWEIGKEIDAHLRGQDKAKYGDELFRKLNQDTKVELSTLYQMHAFYKTYPKLPSAAKPLNWSHYRNLIAIKNDETRLQLEDLVVEKNLGSNRLKKEISATRKKKIATKNSSEENPQLKVKRGKLNTYTVNENGELDLGFNVLLAKPKSLKGVQNKRDYTYKAELERVVDGDTLHVKIDLGFRIFHREILRLAKINVAEANTAEGKKATASLKKILANVKFLILRTNKTDIYGRYVADVFLAREGEVNSDPQKVADEGVYLNQMLLDLGLAVRF